MVVLKARFLSSDKLALTFGVFRAICGGYGDDVFDVTGIKEAVCSQVVGEVIEVDDIGYLGQGCIDVYLGGCRESTVQVNPLFKSVKIIVKLQYFR